MLNHVTHLQIDPTSVCDLKCGYCVGRTWRQGHARLETIDAVFASCANLEYVQAQGEGEPLLGRFFWQIAERVALAGADLGLITNGRHCTRQNAERLVATGVRSVGISIDSLDPGQYERIRGGELARALDGAERLLAQRQREHTDVYFAIVLMRDNFEQLEPLCALSERWGMSPPSVQSLQRSPDYAKHYANWLSDQFLDEHQLAEVERYQGERARIRAEAGLRTFFESLFKDAPEGTCPFVTKALHVRFDGAVFPCCFMKGSEPAYGWIGVDAEPDWSHASAGRTGLADTFSKGGVPHACRDCHILSHVAPAALPKEQLSQTI
jgi:MoaA/NifB/PqqE/SkfB family radical SAM enzyme